MLYLRRIWRFWIVVRVNRRNVEKLGKKKIEFVGKVEGRWELNGVEGGRWMLVSIFLVRGKGDRVRARGFI